MPITKQDAEVSINILYWDWNVPLKFNLSYHYYVRLCGFKKFDILLAPATIPEINKKLIQFYEILLASQIDKQIDNKQLFI